MLRHLLFLCLLLSAVAVRAETAIAEYDFDTPQQEERFYHLIDIMRCPMCLNSNLAGSDAPIAADLRQEIHDQIMEGKSDAEITAFMRARYGDFIMYRPPLRAGTLLLWFGPPVLLLLGFFVVRRMLRTSRLDASTEQALSSEEQRKLDSYMAGKGDKV